MKLWSAKTGEHLGDLVGHSHTVEACEFSPDGRRIVSASGDRTLKIWDAQTGVERVTLAGHSGAVRVCAFSPDSRFIVSVALDRTLRLWDRRSGALVQQYFLSVSVHSFAWSPTSPVLMAGCYGGEVLFWRIENGAQRARGEK